MRAGRTAAGVLTGVLLGSLLGSGRFEPTSTSTNTYHLVRFVPVPNPALVTPAGNTYGAGWYLYSDGGVGADHAPLFGDLPQAGVHVDDVVDLLPTLDLKGYWLIGADGGVFAFGDARYRGSLPGRHVRVDDVVGADYCYGGGYELLGAGPGDAWDFGCDQQGYWP